MTASPALTSSRPLEELSYDAAVAALGSQEAALEQMRSRTGILLAASSLSASFFGSHTIETGSHHLTWLGWVAIAALVATVSLSLYVLTPKKGFVFAISGGVMYRTLYEWRDDSNEMQRRLAYWLTGMWESNEKRKEQLSQVLILASGALMVQLVASTLAWATKI